MARRPKARTSAERSRAYRLRRRARGGVSLSASDRKWLARYDRIVARGRERRPAERGPLALARANAAALASWAAEVSGETLDAWTEELGGPTGTGWIKRPYVALVRRISEDGTDVGALTEEERAGALASIGPPRIVIPRHPDRFLISIRALFIIDDQEQWISLLALTDDWANVAATIVIALRKALDKLPSLRGEEIYLIGWSVYVAKEVSYRHA